MKRLDDLTIDERKNVLSALNRKVIEAMELEGIEAEPFALIVVARTLKRGLFEPMISTRIPPNMFISLLLRILTVLNDGGGVNHFDSVDGTPATDN